MTLWMMALGPPEAVLMDNGGEFNKSFGSELEAMNVKLFTTPAIAPEQNAVCERAGSTWKYHARALIDEFGITFDQPDLVNWLCTCINWSSNSMMDRSGHSPAQWVLGRNLQLPYELWSPILALHARLEYEPSFATRVALLASAQRSQIALRYSRALSAAWLARSRAASADPAQTMYNIGDQVFYWRGAMKRKTQWAAKWLGPAAIIGFEADNI